MRIYIANPTQQIINLAYRTVETAGVRFQPIGIGLQVVLSGDINQVEADYVINQLSPYGLIKADEVKNKRGVISLIYSVDKPVNVGILEYAMRRNKLTLIERGQELRKNAAVAANNAIEAELASNQPTQGTTLEKLEFTVEEEEVKGAQPDEDVGLINEALRVTRSDIPDAPQPVRAARKRKSVG